MHLAHVLQFAWLHNTAVEPQPAGESGRERRTEYMFRVFGLGYPLNETEGAQRRLTESLRLVAFRPGDETNERGSLSGQTSVT